MAGRGAEGRLETVCGGGDFEQHFEKTPNDIRAMIHTIPIMAPGDEKSQWCD